MKKLIVPALLILASAGPAAAAISAIATTRALDAHCPSADGFKPINSAPRTTLIQVCFAAPNGHTYKADWYTLEEWQRQSANLRWREL